MKKIGIVLLALSLAGCATIERHIAAHILSNYVGVWTKEGATQTDLARDASTCVMKQKGSPFNEIVYRDCMEAAGWTLTPYRLK